jgi:hypothetical protein
MFALFLLSGAVLINGRENFFKLFGKCVYLHLLQSRSFERGTLDVPASFYFYGCLEYRRVCTIRRCWRWQ